MINLLSHFLVTWQEWGVNGCSPKYRLTEFSVLWYPVCLIKK